MYCGRMLEIAFRYPVSNLKCQLKKAAECRHDSYGSVICWNKSVAEQSPALGALDFEETARLLSITVYVSSLVLNANM